MKQYILFPFLFLLFSCSEDVADDLTGSESKAVFQVRMELPDGKIGEPQLADRTTKLYVAERLQEHGEFLHCSADKRFVLDGNTYHVANLYGQWYKFAFVSVPKWEEGGGESMFSEMNAAEQTCDFTKLLVDYSEAFAFQKNSVNTYKDMHVYRKVIDRWIKKDEPSLENVVLKRITGDLIFDLGKPADQFQFPVKKISLLLKNPNKRVYIRDEANAEVIVDKGDGSDWIYELELLRGREDQYQLQYMKLALLPDVIEGQIQVSYYDNPNVDVFEIGGEKGIPVKVKPNVRTIVMFNGMEKKEFEIRYAGFNDGNGDGSDAVIDVGEDKWNGWI